MNGKLKIMALFVLLNSCLIVLVCTVRAVEIGDVESGYATELALVDDTIKEMTLDLTNHQEYLLYTILIHIRKADQYRADAYVRTGIDKTLRELLRQKIMTQAELIRFAEIAVNHQEVITNE